MPKGRFEAICTARFNVEFQIDSDGASGADIHAAALREAQAAFPPASFEIEIVHIEPNREDFPDVARGTAEDEAEAAARESS